MYRRPKFLEILLEIRREMALEADYDVDLFAELARTGKRPPRLTLRAVALDETALPEVAPEPRRRVRTGIARK